VGVEGRGAIGPGRVGPHMSRRNAQALWNVGLRESFFWDGRETSLEEQSLRPLENPDELNRDPDEVVSELAAIPAYVRLFEQAFPGEAAKVTRENMARALATFVRAYQSNRAPYDQYLRGDNLALSAQDLRGMALFAELDCSGCHVPPRFESEAYADRHVPNPEGIVDEGRFEHTQVAADRGHFRVPTLRNARETGPYFHNGAVASFEDAVRHEVGEQVQAGLRAALSEAELADLVMFLRRALVDTSRQQHPPESVPSGLPIPLDGDRLLRGGS
jgi:cytochrome c peroxidase